ncbi:hypothetical protein [Actinocorallia libanotica]|uniref:hypothetical protein n=1 Tax=Actinocorallia libanotica TaxID=46162 RepID=UPI0031E07FC8
MTALLALTGTLVVAREDGTVEALRVGEGPGPLLDGLCTVWRSEVPVGALTWGHGEVLGAAGDRLVRFGADGSLREGPALGEPIGALCTRAGKVFAVAGPAVHTLERAGDAWRTARSTPLPEEGHHDLDIDRKGAHAVAVRTPPRRERLPPRGVVVNLETGRQVGRVDVAQWEAESVTEMYARFSPVTDNVYRFATLNHGVEKLARFGGSGRKLRQPWTLQRQPSTLCTPVASCPDGRYVASRQHGIGVLVWDLAIEENVLYAELEDAGQEERSAGWARTSIHDGGTSAVAVAPGLRYAAVGGADGGVTVVDGPTRRIEHADGTVRQPALLDRVIQVGGKSGPGRHDRLGEGEFCDGAWFGSSLERTSATVVDLDSGETRRLDLGGRRALRTVADKDTLAVVHDRGIVGYDRLTLTEIWDTGMDSAGLRGSAYSGGLVLAHQLSGDGNGRIIRYDPRTGRSESSPDLVCRGRTFGVEEMELHPDTGDMAVLASCDGSTPAWHLLRDDAPVTHLAGFTKVIAAQGIGLHEENGTWSLRSLREPDRPLFSGRPDEDLTRFISSVESMAVDLDRGIAVGQEIMGRRLAFWRLDGSAFQIIDGIGEVWADRFSFTDDSLWLHSRRGDRLYRLDLPDPGGSGSSVARSGSRVRPGGRAGRGGGRGGR